MIHPLRVMPAFDSSHLCNQATSRIDVKPDLPEQAPGHIVRRLSAVVRMTCDRAKVNFRSVAGNTFRSCSALAALTFSSGKRLKLRARALHGHQKNSR